MAAIVSVTTDTGISCSLSNGGTDSVGKYIATMTLNGLGAAPTTKLYGPDYQLGVRSYSPPTGVGATPGAALSACGYAMYLAFQAACMAAGVAQTGVSLMRIQQMIDMASLATTGAYVQAGGK